MGKLRKLRKEILRNPDKWRRRHGHSRVAYGAHFHKRWTPDWYGHSYEAFVAHVLREVGNADVRA